METLTHILRSTPEAVNAGIIRPFNKEASVWRRKRKKQDSCAQFYDSIDCPCTQDKYQFY
jgi:hypothetical protein